MAGAFDAGTVSARLILDLNEWTANIEKAKADTTSLAGVINAKKDDIDKLGKTFTVVGAAIVGSLGLMMKSAVDFTLEAGRMAVKTGIAVETISGLREAAEKSGVSMDTLNVGLRRFASVAVDASRGNEAAVKTMEDLGVKATDANGKLKPMDQLLMETADHFRDMANGNEKAALAVDLFGRSGTEMIAMMNRGGDGIRDFIQETKDMGTQITAEGVAKAKQFSIAIKEMDDAMMSIKLVIANALMPTVKFLADAFVFAGQGIRKVLDICPPLTNVITIVIGVLGVLATVLGVVLLASVKLNAAWLIMGPAITKLAAKVVAASTAMSWSIPIYAAIVAGILAVNAAANAYAASQDRQIADIVKNGEQQHKTWTWVKEIYNSTNVATTQAINSMRASLQALGKTQEEIADAIYAKFGKVIEATKQVAAVAVALSEAVIKANTAAMDAIKKATLSEYDYTIWAIKAKYDANKKMLDKEGADSAAFALNEKARQAELTAAHKAEVDKRLEADMKSYDKGLVARKKVYDSLFKFKVLETKDIVKLTQNASMTAKNMSAQMSGFFKTAYDNLVKNGDIAAPKIKKTFQSIATAIGQYVQVMQQGFSQFFSSLQQMSDNRYKAEFAAMDTEYQKKKKAIEDSLLSETEKNAAYTALDKEYADKKKALEIKQAEATKKSGISQAIVNTALAVVSALSTKPFIPMGLIAAAMAAVAGAMQIAVIKSAPLPAMAEGGLVNQPTHVLAGEAGPEAILPMRELQRMLGTTRKGGSGSKTVNFGSISAIDSRGLDVLFTENIIPRIKRAMANESLTVPVMAVR